jgi:hypothetical protein
VFIMATASRMFLKDCSNTLIPAIFTRTYYMSITISKNERVIDVYLKVSEFLAMSWREQVIVSFVLDQDTYLYSVISMKQ